MLSESGLVARDGLEEAEASRRALTNTRQLIDEWHRCINAGATLAATILGCSALEGLFILGCLGRKEQVVKTRAWHGHAKKKRSYVENVSHSRTDLDLLVAIGAELHWFKPEAVPDVLMSQFPSVDLNELRRALEDANSTSCLIPTFARLLRNHLHVGKCLRTKTNLDADFGKAGFAASMLAILSFLA